MCCFPQSSGWLLWVYICKIAVVVEVYAVLPIGRVVVQELL